MTQANTGDTVQIHYSGKFNDGTVFDFSDGKSPLEFKIGENTVIPHLEQSVIGMTIGDKATVEINAENAYGPHQTDAIQTVDRSMIPQEVDLTVGSQLQATTPDDQTLLLTVAAVDDTTVTLYGNHPLAGQDLTFDIELVGIVATA
jgi:peptidylprolyl isomerase